MTKTRAAVALLALGLIVLLVGQPTLQDRLQKMAPQLDADLKKRSPHVDPGELLGLMHDNAVRLAILDTRPDAQFNLFHLVDTRRIKADPDETSPARDLHPESIKIIIATTEKEAEQTWKRFRALGVPNVYLLEGGIDAWLRAYHTGGPFTAALGARYPASKPDAVHVGARAFVSKVKIARRSKSAGGGCG